MVDLLAVALGHGVWTEGLLIRVDDYPEWLEWTFLALNSVLILTQHLYCSPKPGQNLMAKLPWTLERSF